MDEEEKVVRPAKRGFSLSPRIIIVALIVALLVGAAASSFFVVDQTEQAVVLRLGKYNRTVGPGLQTKIPFGIDTVHIVPTQVVQTLTFGYRANDVRGLVATLLHAEKLKSKISKLNNEDKSHLLKEE